MLFRIAMTHNALLMFLFVFAFLVCLEQINGASAYGTPLDGATVKVVITTVNKT